MNLNVCYGRMCRKKLLILVSVGVVLPLLVLTYMQYRSLTELQSKTKGAFKDNLRQGLPILEQVMKRRLEDIANQTMGRFDRRVRTRRPDAVKILTATGSSLTGQNRAIMSHQPAGRPVTGTTPMPARVRLSSAA